MTLPSQSPRINPPASSGARSAQSMRSLFVAVAAIGLGGAAAGWFLTHKSEAPESTEQTASTESVSSRQDVTCMGLSMNVPVPDTFYSDRS